MAYNRNVCKTFNLAAGTKLALADQECSEVVVLPAASTTFFDYRNPNVGFVVPANVVFTFRGLTNSNQLSATVSSGTLSYRTQFFSCLPGY
jgi:hypothetical protein